MLRHQHLIKYLFKRELSEIYISIALRNLALSMMGIFVPLYLFVDLGYPLTKVISFFLIYTISLIFSTLLAAKFTSKYGIKHGILFSMFMHVVYVTLLITLNYHNLFFLPAIFFGMSTSFYWISFHTDFAKFSDKKNRGQEVSLWFITGLIGILLGPIIGSLIISFIGFTTLFIITILVLLLSSLPLFLTSEFHEKSRFLFKDILDKSHRKETYFYIIFGAKLIMEGVALPLYIFILLGKYISLGIIASFAALGSIIIGFFVGRLSKDEKRERTMLKFGSFFHSFGWFLILFVKDFIQVTIVSIYLSMSFIFVDIPHHALMYTQARKKRYFMGYIVYREMMIGVGRFLGILILLITGKFFISFIINGIGILSWFFL